MLLLCCCCYGILFSPGDSVRYYILSVYSHHWLSSVVSNLVALVVLYIVTGRFNLNHHHFVAQFGILLLREELYFHPTFTLLTHSLTHQHTLAQARSVPPDNNDYTAVADIPTTHTLTLCASGGESIISGFSPKTDCKPR